MTLDVPRQIAAAKKGITDAELALELALAAIQSSPRSQKVKISIPLEEAFERLRAAKAILAALEDAESASED